MARKIAKLPVCVGKILPRWKNVSLYLKNLLFFIFFTSCKITKAAALRLQKLQSLFKLVCHFNLKLVSAIFYQFFIFHQTRQPFKNYAKCLLFHLRSSFCSRDIQIFIFMSSPLFLPVSHYFGGWSKIDREVYEIINCLNKNLITHFLWYLEKETKYNSETLSIDKVLNKEHFYGKIMQKMCTKS